jgi:hypothetical protein
MKGTKSLAKEIAFKCNKNAKLSIECVLVAFFA